MEKKPTPCVGCEHERPQLMNENKEAWFLWRHTQTQIRTSMDAVIGLDYVAVMNVAKLLMINFTPALLHKVQVLEQVMLKEVNKGVGK